MTDKELIEEARRTTLYDGMDEFSDLPDRLADALSVHQWRPIDTAPRDKTEVLLGDASGSFEVAAWMDDRWFSQLPNYGLYGVEIGWDPTHWMPLPTPPEE